MGVDHRRFHVTVPKQFLDRANVVAHFQQMRGEAVPQRVRPHRFGYPDASSRFADGPLRHGLVQVMPTPLARARVGRDGRGGKDPLPPPFAVRLWVFTRQRVGKRDASEPCRQVPTWSVRTRSRCARRRGTTADGSIVTRSLSPLPSRISISPRPKSTSFTRRRKRSIKRSPEAQSNVPIIQRLRQGRGINSFPAKADDLPHPNSLPQRGEGTRRPFDPSTLLRTGLLRVTG